MNMLTVFYALLAKKRLVFWDVDPRDYKCVSSEQGRDKVVSVVTRRGRAAIILLHDSRLEAGTGRARITTDAIRPIVAALRQHGYKFCTVSDARGARIRKPARET